MATTAPAQRRGRALDATRARAEAVPWWLWLAAVVLVSALVRFLLALRYPGPWIFNDEMVYSDLARSLGRTGHFAIRGGSGTEGFGFVYPTLLSPAYALFSDIPHAYDAARAINSVVMSLAAVPTYFLARRLVGQWLSLLAAALAVLIPSMTYAAAMMSEVAFFPLVMASAWLIVAALERPTVTRQLLVFVPILLAFYTRAQGVMIAAALATALALIPMLDALEAAPPDRVRRFGAGIRAYAVMWIVLVVGGLAAIIVETARGRSLSSLLGAYGGVTQFHYSFGGVARWFFFHLGEIDVYVGVIPFAAFLYCVFVGLWPGRQTNRPLRIFAAVAASFVFWFAVTAAAYASNPVGNRIEERYFFHIVPLFFVGLVVWLARGSHRWLPVAASAVIAAALPGVVPWDSLLDSNAVNGAFALLPMITLTEHGVSPQSLAEIVSLSAIAGALLYLLVPLRLAIVPAVIVVAYLVAVDRNVFRTTRGVSEGSVRSSISGKRNWIDAAVGSKAEVSILFYATNQTAFWQNEFFNGSVRRVYSLTGGNYDPLPQTLVQPRPQTGILVAADGTKAKADYALTNQALIPAGREVASDPGIGMYVYKVNSPLRLAARVDGVYPDKWSGPTVGYQRYGCRGGSLTVTLLSDRDLHPRPETIVATSGTKTARFTYEPGVVTRKMTVPLMSAHGVCVASFAVPTAVPQQVTGRPDTRELGVRFLRFDYRSGAKRA
jgi:hypothetical protein